MLVEICVEGIEGVAAAAIGGADRIEVCENLTVGGVTPSAGMVKEAVRVFPGPVHVLIRPRGGNFIPTNREGQVMLADIEHARRLGAAGVVVGILREDGAVDLERMRPLIEAARPMSVTFHRAFDKTPAPWEALGELIELGVERVLTSARAFRLRDGIETLAAWQAKVGPRLTILAGGGGTLGDIPALIRAGLSEAHFASAARRTGVTDATFVHELVTAARASLSVSEE
jgi:copper homeostasis protein